MEIVENQVSPSDPTRTQIKVCVSGDAAPHTLTLRGLSTSAKLDYLIVNVKTHQQINVRVTGPTDTSRCASVNSIDFALASSTNESCRDLTNTAWGGDVIITNLLASGNVGSIRAHGLNFASIGGNCTGGANGNAIEIVDRGGESVLQDVQVAGSVLGNVIVESGSIQGSGLVVTGTVGTPTAPVTVSVKNTSPSFITTISSSAFYGTLRGPGSLAAPPTGVFKTTSGPVVGELRISSLFTGDNATAGLRIASDANANIPISFNADAPIVIGGKLAAGKTLTVLNANQGISMGGMEQTARLIVKGSLPAGKSITIGTASKITMGGQVILNADNASGTWAGTVIVGSTVLSPAPAYPISSALLGTGAVGLVPFQFYRQDCSPPQASATSSPMVRNSELAGGSYPAIRLRFYGPVALPAGQDAINTIRVFQGVPPTSLEDEETFNEVDQGPEMTGSWTASLAAVPFNAGRQELRLA